MGPEAANRSKGESAIASTQARARLKRRLKGDLDNIVLKALRKEPSRRYASAEQFAEDIRRHLQGLPVAATPDSRAYRFGKFVRRHKAGVAATGLIAVTVAAGVATTLREARVAVRQRARAERRFNDVRKLANSFLFEFDDAIKNLPGSTPARSLVVKRALEYLDGLAAEARGDRSLQLELVSAYLKVAEVQGDPMFPNLGDSKGSLESCRKAQAILETLSRAEPENQQVRLLLAATYQHISDVLGFSGDTGGAVEYSEKALKVYEGLAATRSSDPEFQKARVTQTYHYANLLRLTGALDQAIAEYQQAIGLSEQMVSAYPTVSDGKIHLATSLDGLGYVLQEKGDTVGALEDRRRGLAIREELTRLDPNDAHFRRQLAFSHHNVGLSLLEAEELDAALAQFRQELSLFEALSAADPKDVQGRRNRSLAQKQIGDVLMRKADIPGALAQYRSAFNIDQELVSADPDNSQALLDLSFSETKVGAALAKVGQRREGLLMLRRGVATQEALIAKDPNHILLHSHVAGSYTMLGNCLLDSADRKSAIECFRKAVSARLAFSEKSPNSITNRRALAESYIDLGKALEANDREDALTQYGNATEVLDRLSASDRSNARYQIALAEALRTAARLCVRMATEAGEPSTRLQHWTNARSLYQRSRDQWQELEKNGKLPPARRQVIAEVSDELARCDESVSNLQAH